MSQYSRNTKKLSPEIYRRRRIAALLALVLVGFLIWGAATALGTLFGNSSTTAPVASPSASQDESSVVVESGALCPPGTITVTALVGDAEGNNTLSFSAKQTPYIWFSLTNTNSVDCTFNAGAKAQFFTVLSGDQTIWSSKNCDRTNLEDGDMILKAGETISSTPQPWDKVFSSDSGCGPEQAPVVTDGSSYHLKAEVSGELSTNEQQFVLN
jgi:hypothetical protein